MVKTIAIAVAIPAVAAVAAALMCPPGASAATAGSVRVNQVGYAASGAKEAFLLAKGTATGAQYQVLNSSGAAIASARIHRSIAACRA